MRNLYAARLMTYRPGLETRQRILAATQELLSEGGLEATTLKAICGRAGILPGSFYNLFDSKEQAIVSVIGDAINAVDPHPHGEETDTLADLVEAYVRFVAGRPDLARIYLLLAVSGALTDENLGNRFIKHHRARTKRFLQARLRDDPGLDPVEAERQIEALLAALNGYALASLLDRTFDLNDHAMRLLEERVP